MEDFSQLSNALLNEYRTRRIPFSLRDYVRMCLEAFVDLISEERPEYFHSAMARFFAALYGGNELFNSLPLATRTGLNSMTIGVPPRRLFELLNDFGRVTDNLSLLEMSSKTIRSSLQENGFPYRPNEIFSLLDQVEWLDWNLSETGDDETLTAWPTITKAADAIGMNKGVLSRLLNKNEIQDNGLKRRDRRVNPVSLALYCKKNGIVFEWTGE